MTAAEKKALLKIMQDVKGMKEQIDYLVEATELLIQIQTQMVKDGQQYRGHR